MTRAPLRVSFVGGGTDIPWFYREHGGAVISAAIDKYVYVMVNDRFDRETIRVSYSETEIVQAVDDIKHDIVRETLKAFGITGGIEIASMADVPAGTGLGSSSSFAVALAAALTARAGNPHPSPWSLATAASLIEINKCGHPIGKQDHYAAAFGGLRSYRFRKDDGVAVGGFSDAPNIEMSLMLFYTGEPRPSQRSLGKEDAETLVSYMKFFGLVSEMISLDAPAGFGVLLDRLWRLKRTLGGVTSVAVDDAYEIARSAGAWGGKLCGAGGGGFLLISAPVERHAAIEKAVGLRRLPFRFEPEGVKVLA